MQVGEAGHQFEAAQAGAVRAVERIVDHPDDMGLDVEEPEQRLGPSGEPGFACLRCGGHSR